MVSCSSCKVSSFAEYHVFFSGSIASYNLKKRVEAVRNCRNIGKKDMKDNHHTPKITVDPETFRVEADGVHLSVEPAERLPLSQGYMLF